jgi:6-pyruvoyltetrahydropterin/6-carboxytetrahydropterin synthase
LQAKIWFACIELDEHNWVTDFGGLKELKTDLEEIFDHTLVISKSDPCLSLFKDLAAADAARLIVMDGVGIEKFAQKVFDMSDSFIKKKTLERVWVEKVEVWEHEKNSAMYLKPEAPVFAISQTFNHGPTIL